MVNLLHLSDLHFGYDKDATARAQRAQALDLLIKEVSRLEAEWRPQVLVISGDLSWQGKPAGYTELGEWLRERLFPATRLTPADCVLVPGNHDIDQETALSLLDRTQSAKRADEVLRPERLAAGFARPFAAFVKFATDFGIVPPRLHKKDNYLAGVVEHKGLRFVCINSAWFCRDSKTDRGELWLGLPQLQSMPLMDPDEYDTAPITAAVLHHPQEWLAHPEYTASEGRENTYAYLAERSHVILSGHMHGAVERPTRCYDRARLFLGGAAYRDHTYRNSFSLFRIDLEARSVTRRPWEFDPRKPEWEEKKPQSYSLRTERLGRGTPRPDKYLGWLRTQTQFIDLHQLKVGPGQVPPPAIDLLYIRLKATAPARRGEELAPGEAMERARPVPLEEALSSRRLVIEGKPGGGKTTFVRWIAWMLSRPAGPPPELPVRGFPLWVRISQLDQHITNTLSRRQPGDPTTAADGRWVAHFLAAQGWDLDEEFFRERLAAQDTVLLLDGLDEAANERRREMVVETIKLLAAQCGCRVVVTARPGAHEGRSTLVGFDRTSIEDLDDPGVDAFLTQWCRWLKRGDEPAAQAYYEELRPAVAIHSIRMLARNPLMLTALAVLHLRRHRLPEQRAQLYEQITDWLAEQAADRHPEFSKDYRLERFGHLALAMQEWKGGQKLQIGIDTAAGLLTPKGQSLEPARGFLENAQADSGIVTLRGDEIAFWHRTFQEYLAARALAGFPDAKLSMRGRTFLYSPEGREVLPLLAGCMAGPARERLDVLFGNLTRHAAAQTKLERKAHAAGVLGNMLADVGPAGYELKGPAKKQYAGLRKAVEAIFERGEARGIALSTRVAAAEALDQASQSRLRTPGQEDYWVRIRGGPFPSPDPKAYQALKEKSLTVPAFRIGKFPVTVWEYGRYLDEAQATPPPGWEEQAAHPGRPVVSVTWHDVQAYCAWASRKWNIRCELPKEEQWEFAARGPEGRIYPWGPEEPDEHRANFHMNVGQPTPVGMFPDGNTPDGVTDMAGNVWEWTRSDCEEGAKVLRGASFYVLASVLRAALRGLDVPVDRGVYVGFRCVRE